MAHVEGHEQSLYEGLDATKADNALALDKCCIK